MKSMYYDFEAGISVSIDELKAQYIEALKDSEPEEIANYSFSDYVDDLQEKNDGTLSDLERELRLAEFYTETVNAICDLANELSRKYLLTVVPFDDREKKTKDAIWLIAEQIKSAILSKSESIVYDIIKN